LGVDLEFLRRVPLFRELPPDALEAVARACIERSYERGHVIFTEEETGRTMYIVKAGRVKVSRWLPSGREVILAFHPSGDYFGEMALIDGQTEPATVTAVSASVILSLDRTRFQELLQNASFAIALLRELCKRCREAWQQIELLTHHQAEARIRSALHHLCESRGTGTPAGIRIDVPLTHRELAGIAGVSRETATRVIRHLVEAKLLLAEGRSFVIPDPAALLETPLLE
jgi:CRP/FNR family transcriptional regulator